MNKKLIRLTESDLHKIVRTSINKILKESLDDRSTEHVPSWALCYLVNGDPTGLEDEEIREIENWLKRTGFTNVCPPNDEEESYFAHYPAFGKAADVYDCVCFLG